MLSAVLSSIKTPFKKGPRIDDFLQRTAHWFTDSAGFSRSPPNHNNVSVTFCIQRRPIASLKDESESRLPTIVGYLSQRKVKNGRIYCIHKTRVFYGILVLASANWFSIIGAQTSLLSLRRPFTSLLGQKRVNS